MKSFHLVPWLPGSLFILLSLGEALEQAPVTEWTTAFFLKSERQIVQNTLLTTIANMTKEWKVTFDVFPIDYRFRSYASVLHSTIGGKGSGSSAAVGDRIPAIWFHRTKGVLVSTALDGRPSYNKFFKSLPLTGEWTKIEVSQSLVSSQYMYSITIGKEQVFTKPNTKPVELSEVEVYAGSPWYSGQKGFIRNLKIEIKTPIDCVPAGTMRDASCACSFFKTELANYYLLIMIVCRSMEHCIFPQRRTPDNKREAFDHHSRFEEGVEGLLRFQSKQLCGDRTVVTYDYRRKGHRKWGQIRRPDPCHMDAPLSWISHIFRSGR